MLRAEEIADEEALLQVTKEAATPTIAPHLVSRMEKEESTSHQNDAGAYEKAEAEGMEEWMDLDESIVINESDMVEGWLETGAENGTPPAEEDDVCSHMHVAAKVGPTTAFASYLARLQAHFESMMKEQSANVIHHLYQRLEEWRSEWVMALTSVSRDRADRLWALLVTYQAEPTCIADSDKKWADSRWQEVVEMLQIDAVRAASVGDFRLPDQSGVIRIEDTQREQASSSGDVLVQRQPGMPWEKATKEEKDELSRHDAELKEEEDLQAERDEELWQSHQAAEARTWDEWAMRTELEDTTRMRPLKRFRVKIAVTDSEHNELAVADLRGEVDIHDVPQVNVVVQERVVQVPAQEEPDVQPAPAIHNATEARQAEEGKEDDQAETVAVASPTGDMDEGVDENMTDLGAIMETVMGRQWFQLFTQRQVDAEMVKKRWGAAVLEIFQVNRDMMDLVDEQEQRGQGPRAMEMRMGDGDVNVGRMSEDDNRSDTSSGAKVFPKSEIVAGRREGEEGQSREFDSGVEGGKNEEQAALQVAEGGLGDDKPEVAEQGGGQQEAQAAMMDGSAEQQVLYDTQLETMDVDSAAAPGTLGTASASEDLRDGSYGEGKVQSDLQGWLK